MTSHLDLDTITLERGNHDSPDEGGCLLEWVSYMAHEPWGDHPQCVSPVIGAFLRRWNDDLDDDRRQMLVPYVAKVIGTNTGTADDERRAWMVTDWMVRTYLPAWLRLARLKEQAVTVEALPELDSPAAWAGMQDSVDAARAAAWDAAWDAAGDAAGDAARAAAGDAARAAAGDAARAAARAAAWDAAWAAARAAAGDALEPTTVSLQASALALLDRLIAVGKTEAA